MKGPIMLNPNPTYATLIISTHPPTSKPHERQIVIGFALLTVWKNADNALAYKAITGVADTLADEAQLLTELADALPHPTFVFGDRINENVIASLERAADRQPAIVAAFLRQRLARFQAAIQVDTAQLARPYGPILHVVSDWAMPAIIIDVVGDAIVDVEAAYDELEQRVIDDWWRFVLP
jgi:hypothetical protein